MAKGGKGKNIKPTTGTDGEDIIIVDPALVETKINGGDSADIITGSNGSDRINAGDGDDIVTGGAGDDTMYGNDGWDTAVFSGDIRDYTFSDGKGNAFIVDGADGHDTLKHFEELEFGNFSIYLDGRNNTQLVEDHTLTVSEDGSASVANLLAGAWDFEGDALTVTGASGGSLNGSELTFDSAGNYEYLAVGETASEEITFTVTDGTNVTTNTVSVTIEGVNDATVTADDAGTTSEDGTTSGNVLTNDTDVDASDVLSVANAGTTALTYGDVTVNADGSWDFIPNAAAQTLAVGESHSESITIEVSDGTGIVTSTLELTVTGENDATVTADDAGTMSEEGSTSGNVLTNDNDIDASDVLSVSNAGTTALTYADVTVNSDGTWSATANAAAQSLAAGESLTESITVDVFDGTGTVSSTLDITVTGENDAPVINGSAGLSGSVTAEAAALDVGSSEIVFTVEQYTGYQTNNLATLQNYAATHTANYTGETSVVDFTDDPNGFGGELEGSQPWPAAAQTGSTGTGGINNTFFARITSEFSVAESDTFTFRTFNDDGVFLMIDGVLIISDSGYHGETAFEGSIQLDPGVHTIELFFFENGGEASLELSVKTSTGDFGLVGNAGGGLGGTALQVADTGTIAFGDVDLSDSHTVSVADGGTGYVGALTASVSDASTGDGAGEVSWNFVADNADLVYLGAGESLTQTYDVSVTDNNGATATETVTVVLNGTNDATEAGDDAATTDEDTATSGNVLANDSDVDTNDVLTVANAGTTALSYGDLVMSSNGDWTFTPNAAAQGLADGEFYSETVTVEVFDGTDTVTSDLEITVTGANDAPVAVADVITPNNLLEDNSFETPVTASHTGNATGSAWTFTGNSGVTTYAPTNPEFSFTGGTTTDGTYSAPDGDQVAFLQYWSGSTVESMISQSVTASAGEYTLEFDAASRANYGQNIPAFEVRIDGVTVATVEETSTDYMTHSITFDIPTDGEHTVSLVAVPSSNSDGDDTVLIDNLVLTANSADISGSVATNDSDVDNGAVLTYALDAPVAGLTMAADGSYVLDQADAAYTALGEGETLEVVANYTVTDEHGASDQSTLSFTMTGSNDLPTVVADSAVIHEDDSASGNVLTNDSDIDANDVLTVTNAGIIAGTYGDLTLNSDGSWSYVTNSAAQDLDDGETGNDVFTVDVSDGTETVSSQLDITVTGADDPIVILEGAHASSSEAVSGANAATAPAGSNGADATNGANGQDTYVDHSNVTHDTGSANDSVTLYADNHGEDGGSGGSGGNSSNTSYYYSHYNSGWYSSSHYYYYSAGSGGNGGDGGNAGSTYSTLEDTTSNVFAGDDEVSISASSTGSDGGQGGVGGDGGSAGGTYYYYTSSYHYNQFWGGRHGDGGDGGDGGNGGYAQTTVSGNLVNGDENDDTIVIEGTSLGGNGGNGANSGRASGGYYASNDGTSGDGGDGGNGGWARVDITNNTASGGDGNDHLSILASATAGVAGNGGSTVSKYYYSYGYHYGNSGANGDGGEGGSTSVYVENNILEGNAGNDLLEIVIDATASTGGTGATAGSEGTALAYVTNNTLSGGTGDDTLSVSVNASGSSVDVQMVGNTFDGGDGNDSLIIEGNSTDFTFEDQGNGVVIMTSAAGDNTLIDLEQVTFDDGTFTMEVLAAEPSVFDGLGVDVDSVAIVENWVPGGLNGYWTDLVNFTSGDDVHVLRVNNSVYSWLDDGWMGRQTGYTFYEGNDVFAVELGGNGGAGNWSRSGIDMGDGDDIIAMDIDSSGNGGVDGWHNGAQFVGGNGNDTFNFDIDVANYAVFTGQGIYMGADNDVVDITIDVENTASGHFGYGNNIDLGSGDDSYSIEINVPDGSVYNTFDGNINGGDGNDTISVTMHGDATNDDREGFSGIVSGGAGDDVLVFDVVGFTDWYRTNSSINGGDGYDVLDLNMGATADYVLTDNNDSTWTLTYDGEDILLSGIEEIQFTDSTLLL